MERNVLSKCKPVPVRDRKKKKAPRRLTHCSNKDCRGVLETVCFRMSFGAKKFGLKRRMLMRECVKCGNRFMDDDCMAKNNAEVTKLDKALTRKRVEEGLLELDAKGRVVWNKRQTEDDL